ncbi:FAD-dependent oxidoreductase [Chitinophaga sp. 212800010-3]|uniref:FAD-dependent oxidoreductase n=1 Tax=unclassified Chitinophaga TaxID=2619133 RepID=UPI002DE3350B|nr:FAD-dependent oxidoreductase [Chitinophaga sp. 212800010-3]
MKKKLILAGCLLMAAQMLFATKPREVDICIYGGTSAGVIAAYTAKKMNKSVLLVSPDKHLGGLSAGGLGFTDIGNKSAITGLARNFYRRIGDHYGKLEQWIFEPHVAEEIFRQYIREANVDVLYEYQLSSVRKENGDIKEITVTGPATSVIRARMFIDCSYEGDLMAKAGVSYMVGREANSEYKETYNGVQLREKHQFPDGIDPYKIPGKPESGLLWGISNGTVDQQGAGDKKVQTYNFRICLSNQPENQVPITKPEDYNPARYELLLRLLEKHPVRDLNGIMIISRLQNGKTDINNNGAFSTDMIGVNWDYPNGDAATRKKIIKAHETYTKGLLYFIGHDERMPEHLRHEMLTWGYPKDEYQDNGHWTPQLYIREARRMIGEYVMSQANCEGKENVTDGVGMAAYTMDSHNCQRIVVNSMVKNEGDVQIGGFGPYPVSYRSLIPKETECRNLLVPVCLSASHIAYGSIRMEPVFMVLAQSAATAAAVAIDAQTSVQKADVKKIQQLLVAHPLADNSTNEILVDDDDRAHVNIHGDWQRVSKGVGYGPSMLTASGDGEKYVRFNPDVKKSGRYRIYLYVPRIQDHSETTMVKISDGTQVKEVPLKPADVKVEGQTSGEWASLGSWELKSGSGAYVEINTGGANGVVVADAVLFVPER